MFYCLATGSHGYLVTACVNSLPVFTGVLLQNALLMLLSGELTAMAGKRWYSNPTRANAHILDIS